jgi:hypothetical protein
LQEGQPGVDVAGALAGLLDQSGNVIAGDVEQALEALRLLVRVNVHALAVLDKLPFERLGIVNLDDTGGNGKQLGKLGSTIALFLVGPRRFGRTSILKTSEDRLGKTDAVVLRFDAESYPGLDTFVTSLISTAAKALKALSKGLESKSAASSPVFGQN